MIIIMIMIWQCEIGTLKILSTPIKHTSPCSSSATLLTWQPQCLIVNCKVCAVVKKHAHKVCNKNTIHMFIRIFFVLFYYF